MLTLPNPIQSAAIARPQHVVLRAGEQVLTAKALRDQVVRRAAYFFEHHIRAGDVVALWGLPDAQFVINLHALGWLGAAAAPLPVKQPPSERARHLHSTGARLVVMGPGAQAHTRACLATALGPGGRLLCSPTPDDDPGDGHGDMDAPAAPQVAERFWPADEVRLVVLSSGSTGAPQPVRLTTTQLFFSAAGSASRLGHHTDDVWLLCLPLHHVGGLSILFRAAFFGACVDMLPHFDARVVADKLARGPTSLVSFVPQMLARVLDAIGAQAAGSAGGVAPVAWAPHPRLRAILLGGAPTPPALLARGQAYALPLCVTWGMTESASQVATTWPGETALPHDCGPPLPFARVTTKSHGGPLQVTGPVVGEACLTTQDWGHLTAAGRVVVEGRCDDILISGGENIAPFEIESVLLAHPQIEDAAVLGIEDATWGQRPVAYVVGSQKPPNDATLATWCRARLAPFKVPAQFIWCRRLPRDALGKLRRTQLLADVHQGVEDV